MQIKIWFIPRVGKNKLLHFEENKTFSNVYQPSFEDIRKGYKYRGRWSEEVFKNDRPLILELGCGKGEYTVGLARNYPDKNYIGIDKKGARIWRGAKTALDEHIQNAVFLRIKLEQLLFCFGPAEVDEVWIAFPEPVPKHRRVKRRITSLSFLETYRKIVKPGGVVHLKTDNEAFFKFSLESLQKAGLEIIVREDDLYNSTFSGDVTGIRTYYERKHLEEGARIKYIQFQIQQ